MGIGLPLGALNRRSHPERYRRGQGARSIGQGCGPSTSYHLAPAHGGIWEDPSWQMTSREHNQYSAHFVASEPRDIPAHHCRCR